MTLLQRLRNAPIRPPYDLASSPFVPIRPETREAVVALVEAAQAVRERKDEVSAYQNDATIQALLEALVPFTEDKP